MAAEAAEDSHFHELGPPEPRPVRFPAIPQSNLVQRSLHDVWFRRRVEQDTSDPESSDQVEDSDHMSIDDITRGGSNSAPADPSEEGPQYSSDGPFVETGHLRRAGARQLEVERAIDVVSLGYCDKRWLVSRKKNKTLGDLTNQWRKTLLNAMIDNDNEIAVDMNLDDWD